jgi:hypothetical protein
MCLSGFSETIPSNGFAATISMILDLISYLVASSFESDSLLTVKFRQPSHEFTFGVGMTFVSYPLVLTPVVQQVHLCMSVLEFSVYAGF